MGEQATSRGLTMKLGMDHNNHNAEQGAQPDSHDVQHYLQRDMAKQLQRPYSVVRDEIVGRHMVAARDIKAGEVIMEDIPLTYGPVVFTGNLVGCRPVCLSCSHWVTGSYLCDGCNWPMCGESCARAPIHKIQECSVFQENHFLLDAANLN